MSWLPMEDAPKDKRILAKRGPNNMVSIVRYNPQNGYSKPRPYWDDDMAYWGIKWMRDNPPTGWQHLPDADDVPAPALTGGYTDPVMEEWPNVQVTGWTATTVEHLFAVLSQLSKRLRSAEDKQLLARVWRPSSPVLKLISSLAPRSTESSDQ